MLRASGQLVVIAVIKWSEVITPSLLCPNIKMHAPDLAWMRATYAGAENVLGRLVVLSETTSDTLEKKLAE